jgi:hypothetical protein
MRTHSRGSQVNFEVQFTSTAGVIQPVTAATLTIQHPLDGFPLINGTYTATYDMTNTSTVTWMYEYNWDSSPSAEGTVFWNIVPVSTAAVARGGNFRVRSNPAATWLNGPSTVTANDE